MRTWKPIETGTSGAVSILGTIAALSGSFAIGLLAFMLFSVSFYEALLIGIFGFAGNLIDSIFGAFFRLNTSAWCAMHTLKKPNIAGSRPLW